jgi:hypothetical protein
MTRADTALVLLLRFVGVTALFALVAVFMPVSWMAATHRWLGLGETPTAPVVEYLARSLSAFYALLGALCLVMASDLERYRPLVRFLGVANAGLLDGLEATTHHGAIDLLREVAPKTTVHADRRFVDNGRVVCSAGIAAGIDMSLHVLARLLGRKVAGNTARQMEYPWNPNP